MTQFSKAGLAAGFMAAVLTGCGGELHVSSHKVYTCKATDGSFANVHQTVYETGKTIGWLAITKRIGAADQTIYMDKVIHADLKTAADSISSYKKQAQNYCDTLTYPKP